MSSDSYFSGAKKQTIEVQILGQKLLLKAGSDPKELKQVVAFVQRKVDELGLTGSVSSTKAALLVALNIADDYLRLLAETEHFRYEVASRSKQLLATLNHDEEGKHQP